MRATTKCLKCGEILLTDCRGCIEAGTCLHKCKGKKKEELVNVKWKIYPENEEELGEFDNI